MKSTLKFDRSLVCHLSRIINASLLAGIAFLSAGLNSCKESLAPYEEPAAVLEGKVKGQYVFSRQENLIKMYISIKNIYDETLQSTAPMKGNIEIEWSRFPTSRKTDSIDVSNLVYARRYDRDKGILTLDPGDSIALVYLWNLIDDNGSFLFDEDNQLVEWKFIDTLCAARPLRKIAREETFIIRGQFFTFKQAAPARFGPTPFSFCYVNKWVEPTAGNRCYWIYADSSCVYRYR
jgi:hypothetical protein